MKVSFIIILITTSILYSASAAYSPQEIEKISKFAEVYNKLIGAESNVLTNNPSKTIIFIDIDNTLLAADRSCKSVSALAEVIIAQSSAKLIDPLAVSYIHKLSNIGFKVAFLTSRRESERAATVNDLKAVGIKDKWDIPVYITNGVRKGQWLVQNSDVLKNIKAVVHVDDHDYQLNSVKDNIYKIGINTCQLFHFGNWAFKAILEQKAEIDGYPATIDQFKQQSASGGVTNSAFILHKVPEQFLGSDEFKEEVLDDPIYQATDNLSRFSEFLPGEELGFTKKASAAASTTFP